MAQDHPRAAGLGIMGTLGLGQQPVQAVPEHQHLAILAAVRAVRAQLLLARGLVVGLEPLAPGLGEMVGVVAAVELMALVA